MVGTGDCVPSVNYSIVIYQISLPGSDGFDITDKSACLNFMGLLIPASAVSCYNAEFKE